VSVNLFCDLPDSVDYKKIQERLASHIGLEQCCQEVFREKIGISNEALFQKIWYQAVNTEHIRFNSAIPLDRLISKIDAAIRKTFLYHGKGVDFSIDSVADPATFIKYLLGKGTFPVEFINRLNLKAVLIRKNPELLKKMRDVLRQVLLNCSQQVPKPNSPEELVFQTFIGNVIALLPYSYPEKGEEYVIPMRIDGKWKTCTYQIDQRIDLTYQWFSTPIVAYGLLSKDGPPLLTFLGTSYPTGSGCLATLLADFTPGYSVGLAPYLQGKKRIADWLQDKNSVHLFGLSLGGSLTLHVARNYPEKIGQVDAYNPAGLYPWDWKGKEGRLPTVNVYYQNNDLVATMGFFPDSPNVSIYRIIGQKSENFIQAHMRAYSGSDEVVIVKSSPAYENRRCVRKILTFLHFLLGFIVFIPVLTAYIIYCILIRPLYHVRLKHTHLGRVKAL